MLCVVFSILYKLNNLCHHGTSVRLASMELINILTIRLYDSLPNISLLSYTWLSLNGTYP